MIKICLIGCGKIADAHATAISSILGCRIAAVCDREEMMARQLSERFGIGRHFHNVHEMLETVRPDVVHVTTPPQSHFEIGRTCLDAGCHVYIEKPFSVNAHEAEELIRLAGQKRLKLTVGTDEQFTHVAVAMRKLIADGYLGGPPVHMEVYYSYDLGDERYARAFLDDSAHWLRSLPGQLMHNIISHGIAKIAEYLAGDQARVIAHGFTSGFLRDLGENSLIDELRAIIVDHNETTAYFTFSTQMRPLLKEFRIFGPKNGLAVNQEHHSLIKQPGASHKSYAEKFLPLHDLAKQYRRNMWANAKLFLKNDFQMKTGLRHLIESFYDSISHDSPPPIPYREILLTARIMDSIFAQVAGRDHPS